MKVGDLFAVLHLDRKAFTKGLAVAKGEAGGFGKVFAKAAAGASLAIAAIGAVAINMAADFQKAMANVQTLIGKGSVADARIKELSSAVKDMSMETGKSLDDLSGGLYEIIGTFGDSADAVGLLEVSARAGAAGMSTTQDAVRLLAALTKSYGDTSVEAAQHSADLAFQTANLGVTTFPEMAQAMGRVIPTAAALKISQEELFAVLATLTGVTGGTDEVVTQLRGAMTAMLKPSREMKKALAELGYTGVSAGQDIVSEHGLVGAIQLLDTTNAKADLGVSKLYRNTNTLNAVLALTGGQAETFAQKFAAMNDVAGVTNQAFEIQQATVTAMGERVAAAIGVMMVNLGEKLLPMVQTVLNWILDNWPAIAGTFDTVATVIGKSIELVVGIIGRLIEVIDFVKPVIIGAAIAVTAAMLPALASMAASAVATGIAMAFAFAIPTAVILAIIAAVVAASAAINYFAMDFGDMGDRIHNIADKAKVDFNDVKEWIRDRMSETGESFEEASAQAELHFGVMTDAAKALANDGAESFDHFNAAQKGVGTASEEMVAKNKKSLEDMGMNVEDFEAQTGLDLDDVGVSLDDLGIDFEDMAGDVGAATEEADAEVKTFVQSMLETLQAAEDPVRAAGEAASAAWLDPIKTATEISALEAEMGSKELRDKLHSEDANIVRDAQLRTSEITAELIKLKNEQATQGDEMAQIASTRSLLTSQFMKDGLASKDQEIQLTFKNWKETLEGRIRDMERAARNARIGDELAAAISSRSAAALQAARDMASQIKGVFPSSEPKDPKSPFRGITRGWGIGDVLAEGFGRSLASHDFAGLFRGSMTPVAATASAGARSSGGEHAAAGGGDRNYNIYGLHEEDVTRAIVRAERRLAVEWDI